MGHRYGEECGLTGGIFMGQITKDPLMSSVLNVMFTKSGELRSRDSGGGAGCHVDVHQHHVSAREGAEVAWAVRSS